MSPTRPCSPCWAGVTQKTTMDKIVKSPQQMEPEQPPENCVLCGKPLLTSQKLCHTRAYGDPEENPTEFKMAHAACHDRAVNSGRRKSVNKEGFAG